MRVFSALALAASLAASHAQASIEDTLPHRPGAFAVPDTAMPTDADVKRYLFAVGVTSVLVIMPMLILQPPPVHLLNTLPEFVPAPPGM